MSATTEQNQHQEKTAGSEVQYLFVGNKAGMNNVNKEQITKIINQATHGSDFHRKQETKKNHYDMKVKEMKELIENLKQNPQAFKTKEQLIKQEIMEIQKQQDLSRIWVHFDMDMFFVACELQDRPELKDLPVAVGGQMMISTANYVARQYGVRSAMPGFIAKKICPQLIFVPCNFQKYRKASELFKDVLCQYDPLQESMGLDEANLDLTDYLAENGLTTDEQVYELCMTIRKQVFEATNGLTCSCGIAGNKMLAKISSDINKPNGQFQLKNDRDAINKFMADLPVRKIPGIGNVTEQLLRGLGIEKCGQILEHATEISACFSEGGFESLISSALGIGRNFHVEEEEKKSISVSRTFPAVSTVAEIHEKISYLSKKLAAEAIDEQKVGKHISVTFKTTKYQMRSKNRMIDRYIQDASMIEKYARELVKELLPTDPLRLIGIRLSQLEDPKNVRNRGLDRFFVKNEQRQEKQIKGEEREKDEEDDDEDEDDYEEDNNSDDNTAYGNQKDLKQTRDNEQQNNLMKPKTMSQAIRAIDEYERIEMHLDNDEESDSNKDYSWVEKDDDDEEEDEIERRELEHMEMLRIQNSKKLTGNQVNQEATMIIEKKDKDDRQVNIVQTSREQDNLHENLKINKQSPTNYQEQPQLPRNTQPSKISVLNTSSDAGDLLGNSSKRLSNESMSVDLKKKFMPRYFECPICMEQIDSLGNSAFLNNHITQCLEQQNQDITQMNTITHSSNSNTGKLISSNISNTAQGMSQINPTKGHSTSFNRQLVQNSSKRKKTNKTLDAFLNKHNQS